MGTVNEHWKDGVGVEKQRWNSLRLRGLRQRWIFNSIVPILAMLVLIVALFSAGVSNYYYGSMQKGLESRAQALANSFNEYFMDNGFSSYYQKAVQSAESFEDKNRIELQFIGAGGQIQVSTSGLTAGTSPRTGDIAAALQNQKMEPYQGRDLETGETIMAVSCPLMANGRVVGIVRLVTSLRAVNRQVLIAVLAIFLIALLCMALVVISNLLFINNVVEPVAVVTDAAKRITAGSYGFLLENKYTDELGELVNNINNMSLKISQNEKMKRDFISSVSHELRTPLTAINGWGETILEDIVEDTSDPEQLRRGLRIIVNESRRLSNMVEELLEFSKMEDGRFTLQIEEVDLQAELEDAIFTYQELFRQEGITLEYSPGDGDLPLIPGDPERLKQVFCNVLDNASKHGGAGKRITASIAQEGGEQVVQVRDYGPGIPEAELPFIKQKFYKGTSKARGSGIGLAVCDEIINLHNGTFSIGNAEGGGAVVTIRLPVRT
jgi:signal transduction histidine kinase